MTASGPDVSGWMDAQTPEDLRARGSLKWTAPPAGVIGAFVAESDLPLAPAVERAVVETVRLGRTGYLPPGLEAEVGAALAAFQHARFGWDADPGWVRLLPDVLAALSVTAQHLVDPELPIVLPTPAYMPFLELPGVIGKRLVTVPMDVVDGRYRLDPQRLAAALAGGGLLVLVNPHNPTGQVATRDELLAVADVVTATGATVFADEIHSPVVYPGATHLPYASLSEQTAGHTVTATSASKGWNLPGLCCAQLILTGQEHRRRWAGLPLPAKHGTSVLGAVAAVAAYTDGVAHLDATVQYLDTGRLLFADELATVLPAAGYRPPQASYLHWVDLRPLGVEPSTVAASTGVLGTDGTACGAPGFLRLTLGTSHRIVRETARRLGRLAAA